LRKIQTINKEKTTPEIDLSTYKPKDILDKKTNTLIALGIFLFTLIIYILTKAKSMSFWDCGEYITCSSILGIPHAPGNPLYILLGRFFTIFSFGFDHASVISFLSSLSAALGVMMTYLITVQLLSMWSEKKSLLIMGGFIASTLTAFSYTYWANASEAGVYATSALIMNLIIWLTLYWVKNQKDFSHQNYLLLIIYLFFLGFCIHQTILQIAPAILFIIILPYLRNSLKHSSGWIVLLILFFILTAIYFIFNGISDNLKIPEIEKFAVGIAIFAMIWWYLRDYIDDRIWLVGLLMVVIGFSPHLFLLIRSEFRPFINEGHPHNYELFMKYILREQYTAGQYGFLDRKASIGYQIDYHFLRYIQWQFLDAETVAGWLKAPEAIIRFIRNIILVFFGVNGFYYAYKRNKNAFWYILSLFFMTSVAMIFVMNLPSDAPRDRDYFFFQAYNLWAIAMGIGAVGFIQQIGKFSGDKTLKWVLMGLFYLYPMVNMMSGYHRHDRTGELIAYGYGLNILNSLEENAIIFTNGDNDTFPVWYAQAVADKHGKEYVYEQSNVYPSAKTKDLLKVAKSWKEGHLSGIRRDVSVANLSLLNTPWYIKQLRDLEGIEINWNDAQIDGLRYTRLGRDMPVQIFSPNGERLSMLFEEGSLVSIKEFAVAKIVQDNFGKRPIYFAITCSEYFDFDDYLVNEGMVSRITATNQKKISSIGSVAETAINPVRMKNNLDNVYSYASAFDDKVYKDQNMKNMIRNYGAAHIRLSDYYQNEAGDFDNAIRYFERAFGFMPDKNDTLSLYGSLGLLYVQNGQTMLYKQMIDDVISKNPDYINLYVFAAYAMLEAGLYDLSFDYIEAGFIAEPDKRQISRSLISLLYTAAMEHDMQERAGDIVMKHMRDDDELKFYILDRMNEGN